MNWVNAVHVYDTLYSETTRNKMKQHERDATKNHKFSNKIITIIIRIPF